MTVNALFLNVNLENTLCAHLAFRDKNELSTAKTKKKKIVENKSALRSGVPRERKKKPTEATSFASHLFHYFIRSLFITAVKLLAVKIRPSVLSVSRDPPSFRLFMFEIPTFCWRGPTGRFLSLLFFTRRIP